MSVARPNVQEDIGKLRSIRYINFYHLYLWFNQPALGFLEGSWNSSLCVEIFRSYMIVANTSLLGADHAKPSRRTVHSRSTTHRGSCKTFSQNCSLSIAIREGRSHMLIKEVHTCAWRVCGLVYGATRVATFLSYADNKVFLEKLLHLRAPIWWHACNHFRRRAPLPRSKAAVATDRTVTRTAQRPTCQLNHRPCVYWITFGLQDASANAATTVAVRAGPKEHGRT